MNTDAEVVSSFVRAVKRQTAVIITGGLIVALLLLGLGAATLGNTDQIKRAVRAAGRSADESKRVSELAASFTDPDGDFLTAQRAKDADDEARAMEDRAKIIAAVNDAIAKATTLVRKNEDISRALAASESARRNDTAVAAKREAELRALLAELVTRQSALLAALNRPPAPSSPPTTLPPPSSGLCAVLGPIGAALGCPVTSAGPTPTPAPVVPASARPSRPTKSKP